MPEGCNHTKTIFQFSLWNRCFIASYRGNRDQLITSQVGLKKWACNSQSRTLRSVSGLRCFTWERGSSEQPAWRGTWQGASDDNMFLKAPWNKQMFQKGRYAQQIPGQENSCKNVFSLRLISSLKLNCLVSRCLQTTELLLVPQLTRVCFNYLQPSQGVGGRMFSRALIKTAFEMISWDFQGVTCHCSGYTRDVQEG